MIQARFQERGLYYISAIYLATVALAIFGLPGMKALVTGAAGPQTRYYSLVIFAPAAFLLLGAIQGWRVLLSHLALFGAAAAYVGWRYPADPIADFQRQLTWVVAPLLLYLYGAGALAAIFLNRRTRLLTLRSASPRTPGPSPSS